MGLKAHSYCVYFETIWNAGWKSYKTENGEDNDICMTYVCLAVMNIAWLKHLTLSIKVCEFRLVSVGNWQNYTEHTVIT